MTNRSVFHAEPTGRNMSGDPASTIKAPEPAHEKAHEGGKEADGPFTSSRLRNKFNENKSDRTRNDSVRKNEFPYINEVLNEPIRK